MRRLTGIEGRPYPNVQGYEHDDGHRVYAATLPGRLVRGRKLSRYLGTFDSPELAYFELLTARAKDLRRQADAVQREADDVLAELVRRKPNHPLRGQVVFHKKRGRPRKEAA
jgi:hypothetical protein